MKYIAMVLIILASSLPFVVRAGPIQRPYGGYVTFAVPCTCSFGWIISYVPLYPLDYPWTTHSLVWQPGISIPFAFQQFVLTPTPTSWQLGSFTPGISQCLLLAPVPADPCIPLQADGTIFMAGASSPGFSPK